MCLLCPRAPRRVALVHVCAPLLAGALEVCSSGSEQCLVSTALPSTHECVSHNGECRRATGAAAAPSSASAAPSVVLPPAHSTRSPSYGWMQSVEASAGQQGVLSLLPTVVGSCKARDDGRADSARSRDRSTLSARSGWDGVDDSLASFASTIVTSVGRGFEAWEQHLDALETAARSSYGGSNTHKAVSDGDANTGTAARQQEFGAGAHGAAGAHSHTDLMAKARRAIEEAQPAAVTLGHAERGDFSVSGPDLTRARPGLVPKGSVARTGARVKGLAAQRLMSHGKEADRNAAGGAGGVGAQPQPLSAKALPSSRQAGRMCPPPSALDP